LSAALVAAALWLAPLSAWGELLPDDLSRSLTDAFLRGAGIRKTKSEVTDRTRMGIRIRTLTFAVGGQTYRVVFSPDGFVTVTLQTIGELAPEPIWKKPAESATAEEIVNLIYFRETGRSYATSGEGKPGESDPDRAEALIRKKVESRVGEGSELRWSHLIDQVMRGESPSPGSGTGGDGGFEEAAAMGRALDPCGGSKGSQPRRAVATAVAQAMAATLAAMEAAKQKGATGGDSEGLSGKSRTYNRYGSSSLLDDLSRRAPSSEEMIRLIRETGKNPADLFQKALMESDKNSKDPYSVAAGKNFTSLHERFGREKSAGIVRRALEKIVVDITLFMERRPLAPGAPVIYDRTRDRYFVDPTLGAPSEVRYLLSLASWYEGETERFRLDETIAEFERLEKKISEMERVTLAGSDDRALDEQRSKSAGTAARLIEFAVHVTKDPAISR
jgi:hypothetical protein